MQLTINNVRLAFPVLFEPKAMDGEGKPAYSACFILEPSHPQIDEINAAIDAVAKTKWEAKAPTILKQLRATNKVAIHDGDNKATHDGFAGNQYIATRSMQQPTILDANKNIIASPDGRIFSGCFVEAKISLWAQDNNFGKRINALLRGVRALRGGEPFGSIGAATVDEFADLPEYVAVNF